MQHHAENRCASRSDLSSHHATAGKVCSMKTTVEDKHYTPQELAEAWGVSAQTIREIFRREPGVLKIGSNGTRTRRAYKLLRTPASVAQRVHNRLSA